MFFSGTQMFQIRMQHIQHICIYVMFQLNLDLFRLSAGNNLNADSYYRSTFTNVFCSHRSNCSNHCWQRLLNAVVALQSTFMVGAFLISRCCSFGKYRWSNVITYMRTTIIHSHGTQILLNGKLSAILFQVHIIHLIRLKNDSSIYIYIYIGFMHIHTHC